MALLPSISDRRSAPSLQPTTTITPELHLIPRPLRITKRTPTTIPLPPQPLTKPTLATPTLNRTTTINPIHPTHHAATPDPPPAPPTHPPTCALCPTPLSPHNNHTFPPTAPAITHTILSLLSLSLLKPAASHHHILNPPAFPPRSPHFCNACFGTLHGLRLCWGCGEPVARAEERVGCGWAWWHWGCVRCLRCRRPLAPPPYEDRAVTLDGMPACGACAGEVGEVEWREGERGGGSRGEGGSDGACDGRGGEGVKGRPLPKWMEKLPGNRRGGGYRGDRGRVGGGSGGVGGRSDAFRRPSWIAGASLHSPSLPSQALRP